MITHQIMPVPLAVEGSGIVSRQDSYVAIVRWRRDAK